MINHQPTNLSDDDDSFHLTKLKVDQEYFWSIWVFYKRKIFNYCLYRLRLNYHDAEDLCSETMLKAYSSLPKANIKTNIIALLYRICKCSYFDSLRRINLHQRYEREVEVDLVEVSISNYLHEIRDVEALQYVKKIVIALPEKVSPICWAYFFEEKSYREISIQLGCSEAYARKQIYKVRQVLAPAYHRYINEF